jgi:Calcium-activated potassium channel, beta subunit
MLEQCSYSVCYATREENARLVREFVERYEMLADRSFNCYYDSETSDNVVDRKVYTRWDVVHCILWPSLLLVACAVVFLYVKLVRREGATYHVHERSVDPQLHHQHHHQQHQQHRTSHNL